MKNQSLYTLRRAQIKRQVEDLIAPLPLAEQSRLLNDIVSDSIATRYRDRLRALLFSDSVALDFKSSVNYKLSLVRPEPKPPSTPNNPRPRPSLSLSDLGLDL